MEVCVGEGARKLNMGIKSGSREQMSTVLDAPAFDIAQSVVIFLNTCSSP